MKAFALFFFIGLQPAFSQMRQADTVLLLMGSRYELSAIHEDVETAKKAINAGIEEIRRIENLISSWKEDSQTSAINSSAGVAPVKVDKELYNLIERSKKVSDLTDGFFDISFAPVGAIWDVKKKMDKIPEQNVIDSARGLVNYKNIILSKEEQTVFLTKKGMKIGFGAIGKGYSANRARQVMTALGIEHGVVNAGGDLTTWGSQLNGTPWTVGIADPEKKEKYIAWLNIKDMSVVTSGNYEKYIEIEGVKYTHIINPKTGYPCKGIKSVTVLSPDAELSDALATSVFVMGVKKGLELVDRLKNIDCLIIDENNKIWQSEGLKLNFY